MEPCYKQSKPLEYNVYEEFYLMLDNKEKDMRLKGIHINFNRLRISKPFYGQLR